MSKFAIVIVALLVAMSLATPVFAYDSDGSSTVGDRLNQVKTNAEQTVSETREKVKTTRDQLQEVGSDTTEMVLSHKERIEQHRSELKQKIEASHVERKIALKDKRLELCEKRQGKINGLIASSAKMSREQLAHIQEVESKVKDFYSRKELVSAEYDSAAALVDEKEALAVAAVEVAESQKFDCAKVDGEKPSGEIKSLHETKRSALKDYRDSVKQLIQIVKAAHKASVNGGAS